MSFYVLDENNNKVEAYDKQGVLAVLAQAIADGSLDNITADSAFINKLKCCVGGDTFNIAFITQAKYNDLEANGLIKENTYYYIIDDTTADDIDEQLQSLTDAVNSANRIATQVNKDFTAYKNIDQVQILSFSDNNKLIYDNSLATQPAVDLNEYLADKNINNIIGLGGVLYVTVSNATDGTSNSYELFFTAFSNEYDGQKIKEHQVIKAESGSIKIFIFSLGITNGSNKGNLELSSIICKNVAANVTNYIVKTVYLDTLRIYYKK